MKIKLILGLLLFFILKVAQSSVYDIYGSWEYSSVPEIGGPFDGSFSLSFDDSGSLLTGTGNEFEDVSLTSFIFNGVTYGGFDISNSGASLSYYNGDLFAVVLGNEVNGYGGISHYTDDFYIPYSFTGPRTAYFTESSVRGLRTVSFGRQSIQVFRDDTLIWGYNSAAVPAAIWLFGTALIGLVGFSKRRKAA